MLSGCAQPWAPGPPGSSADYPADTRVPARPMILATSGANQERRRATQSALATSSDVLACPWPRVVEPPRRSTFAAERGPIASIASTIQQVWARPGRLPREVEALAGGFTDAATTCPVDGEAEQGQAGGGIASWWRYQGFRL